MNIDNFNFISTYPTDMITYFHNGTINTTQWAGYFGNTPNTVITVHNWDTEFIPSIRYSWDNGVTWHQDGETNLFWYAPAYQFLMDTYMIAKTNASTLIIESYSSYYARNNVIYEVYGIKKNV